MNERISVKTSSKTAKAIVQATFPDWKGRKMAVEFGNFKMWDLNWSGGTRNRFAVVRMTANGMKAECVPAPAPWANQYEGMEVEMRPDFIVVEHSYFCGKDAGITIHADESYRPRFVEMAMIAAPAN